MHAAISATRVGDERGHRAAHAGGLRATRYGYQIKPHTKAPVSRPGALAPTVRHLHIRRPTPLIIARHHESNCRAALRRLHPRSTMNPNLGRLQPYPFQKLAALFKGLPANAGARTDQPVHRRAQARHARVHPPGPDREPGRPGVLSRHRRQRGAAPEPSPAGSSAATASHALDAE